MSRPVLEQIGDEVVEIVKDGTRLRLTGRIAARVWWWYSHQLTHGQVYADIYLAGVVHGLEYETVKQGERLLAEVRARRY
jgi:hypothetical protein